MSSQKILGLLFKSVTMLKWAQACNLKLDELNHCGVGLEYFQGHLQPYESMTSISKDPSGQIWQRWHFSFLPPTPLYIYMNGSSLLNLLSKFSELKEGSCLLIRLFDCRTGPQSAKVA